MLPVWQKNNIIKPLKKMPPSWLQIIIFITAVYAFTSHLGYLPINSPSDEARRALVTAEMMISHNYLTPTLNGELYFLKPPLYNWILIISFKLFGNYSSFALRFPVIISLFLFAIVIFYFVKKNSADARLAYITAFAFITNGRILFYDSLQGLIDATFSLLTYLCFMLIYSFGLKQKWNHLFICAYILTAVCFLLKGFPSLVALGLTLCIYFIYTKQVKILFSLHHLTGIITFILLTGCYYYLYFSVNQIKPQILFQHLLDESTKRTAFEFSAARVIKHLVSFPLQLCYHFAPWFFLIIILFRKNAISKILSNPFIKFNALVFLVNIIVYWTSPEEYPRYLFMLVPLAFTVLLWLYFQFIAYAKNLQKTIDYILAAGIIIAIIITTGFMFSQPDQLAITEQKIFLLLGMTTATFILFMKKPAWRPEILILFLLVCRIGFNFFVLEERGKDSFYVKEKSKEIVKIIKDKPLYLLEEIGNTDTYSFYISTLKQDLVRYNSNIDYNAFYLARPGKIKQRKIIVYTDLRVPFADSNILLIKFIPETAQQIISRPPADSELFPRPALPRFYAR